MTTINPGVYLQSSSAVEFPKGAQIYGKHHPATRVYQVVAGTVSVVREADDGYQVMVDIYKEDEFFGEAALLDLPRRGEFAVALTPVQVKVWSALVVEAAMLAKPRLGVMFSRLLAQRSLDFTNRIEGFSRNDSTIRIVHTLMRFSERLGALAADGSIHMMALTHSMLSQYAGTTKAFATKVMIDFRRDGYIEYSKKEIVLYPERFKRWLESIA